MRINTYPDKDEDLGITDSVFALRHADHRELGWASAALHQIANL